MLDPDFLQKLSARAAGLLPAAEAKRKELEQDMYKLLQGSLAKLNVVTREEFDAQQAVLERTRAQMLELERKVAELEQHKTPG
jgi:BMFP domain-containing protein YqiC